MKNLFVPYELAVKLKEKGFDEPCLTYYFADGSFNDALEEDDTRYPGDPRFYEHKNGDDENISAPLYQQVTDWFREKHGIHIVIDFNAPDLGYSYTVYYKKENKVKELSGMGHNEEIEKEFTYYEALSKAIEESLKLIPQV